METKLLMNSLKKLCLDIFRNMDVDCLSTMNDSIQVDFKGIALTVICSDEWLEIRKCPVEETYKEGLEWPCMIDKHTGNMNLKKMITFFLLNIHKFDALLINSTTIKLSYTYHQVHNQVKRSPEQKRLENNIPVKDLIYLLLFYKGGCIFDENDGIVSVANREDYAIQGFGYDFNIDHAKFKAIAEYLERSAASSKLPHTLKASYREIQNKAVYPKVLGVYDGEVVDKYNDLEMYNDDLSFHWVLATSLLNDKEEYIPEQISQYLRQDIKNRYVYESSNGCSVGNSIEEASLYSILEIVERDIFMNFWFEDEHSIHFIEFDRERSNILGRELYFEELGYHLEFYYIKNKTELPVVWCLLRSVNQDNIFYSITGLGCHINIQHAIDSAFYEVYNSFQKLANHSMDKVIEHLNRIEKTNEINDVLDHIYYFLSYRSKPLVEQKLKSAKSCNYTDLTSKKNFQSIYVEEELSYVKDKVKRVYKDILIVNQTNDFMSALSLYCTKAILIGAAPLDFTSHLIRLVNDEKTNRRIENRNVHPLA
ncbi:YcaO-like family protein [Chengkuizengella axinellae]|uniref:YcaO-like family protein n=1 Tax=Chengkuizengella axinellae TaxID=3064388 RepID=A0ABT9ITK0_9BACL|nr:YcaO-like family protein [Chengkuizengella sp. 2205SS18-9]MDP5272680.1 YcaO-like family protein [Chengkuizengella sp. 2205SS18-9]